MHATVNMAHLLHMFEFALYK